ncbi:glutaredoxin family protein [Pseudarthrobacter sp. BIM B-2242]|uniref:glutaredoxin family protein n=1 Tax=Pseudarthrobacter sp. BIM B-2242 TaxID=2772401 RepID=UPI00168A52E4|nr:glutaredoxin family protein [Pseudarthrobacter sp. BIM B-2242]QOD05908.1 glutaredoxin family protein [Pseudarthrobacter sp. BIM B-2242]
MTASVLEAPANTSAGSDFTLEIYSKPACVQCGAAHRKARKNGIVFVDARLHEDNELNQEAVRELGISLGVASAPLCIIRAADGTITDSWGGFNPGKMDEWADRLPMTPEAAAKKAAEIAAASTELLAA